MSEAQKNLPAPAAPTDALACRRRWLAFLSGASAALERWQQRQRLLQLDERMLRDIGISRCDAEREAAKLWRE